MAAAVAENVDELRHALVDVGQDAIDARCILLEITAEKILKKEGL